MKTTKSIRGLMLAAFVGLLCIGGFGTAWAQTIDSYQSDPTVILESIVKNVDWSGPKLTMTLSVAAATSPTVDWLVEGPPLAELLKQGWTPNDIKIGDKFAAIVAPDNSKRRTAALLHIVYYDGRTLSVGRFGLATIVPPYSYGGQDPMAGFYGNTEICESDKFECHVWFYPNHRFLLFSRDQQADGSWTLRGVEGTDWVEKLDGKYVECITFDGRVTAPFCHSPVFFQKPGDHWEAYLANGTREMRSLIAGHH